MTKYTPDPLDHAVAITKALADPQRLRLLLVLGSGEYCACQLTELLALAPSTVSKHLSILRQAGLVAESKRGRWRWFSLTENDGPAAAAVAWLRQSTAASRNLREDARRMKAIMKIPPEELCRRQCGKNCDC